MTVINY